MELISAQLCRMLNGSSNERNYTDGRIVRTQRFFETKVRTHSKLEPTNFKIGSKFHFFLHKWLKTKKSLSRPCSRVSGKLCTKCCISYIKRTLDSRTHEVSKGKKIQSCLHKWLKMKKSLGKPLSRAGGKLCTKCCISYIKRTLAWFLVFSKLEPTKCPNVKNAILPA